MAYVLLLITVVEAEAPAVEAEPEKEPSKQQNILLSTNYFYK